MPYAAFPTCFSQHFPIWGCLGYFQFFCCNTSLSLTCISNNKGFLGGSVVKNPSAKKQMWVQFLGQEDPQEKETATHSSILAWEIPYSNNNNTNILLFASYMAGPVLSIHLSSNNPVREWLLLSQFTDKETETQSISRNLFTVEDIPQSEKTFRSK